VLSSGIDMGDGDLMAPEQPDTRAARIINRLHSQDVQLVNGRKNDAASTTTPARSAPESKAPTSTNTLPVTQGRSEKLANPTVIALTRVETPIPVVANTPPPSTQSLVRAAKAENLQRAPLTAAKEKGAVTDVSSRVKVAQVDPSLIEVKNCQEPGQRSETPLWATHTDQGATSATANAVESGKGPDLGGAYFAGSQGRNGTIMKVASGGGCVYTIVVAPIAGEAVVFNGIDVNSGHIYAVGNVGADQALIVRAAPAAGTVTSALLFSAAGVSVRLNGVGITDAMGAAAAKDVSASGTIIDPALGHTENALWAVNVNEGALATNYSVAVTFTVGGVPIDAEGLDVDVGRFAAPPTNPSHESYHVGYVADGTSKRNLTMRLSPGMPLPAVDWALTFSAGGHTLNPYNAMNGVNYIAGSGAKGSGLITVGSYEFSSGNPGFASALIAKWTPATGTPLLWGWAYWQSGFDLSLTDVVVNRATGAAYISRFFGLPGDHDAGVITANTAGGLGGGFDIVVPGDQFGTGIDVVLPTPLPPRDYLLSANSATGDMGAVTGTECDTSYNGGADGHGSKWSADWD
jgi:hypothetical protein